MGKKQISRKTVFQGQEAVGVNMINKRKISPYANLYLKLLLSTKPSMVEEWDFFHIFHGEKELLSAEQIKEEGGGVSGQVSVGQFPFLSAEKHLSLIDFKVLIDQVTSSNSIRRRMKGRKA